MFYVMFSSCLIHLNPLINVEVPECTELIYVFIWLISLINHRLNQTPTLFLIAALAQGPYK